MSASSSTSGSDLRRLGFRLLLPFVVTVALIAALDVALSTAGLQPRLFGWGKTFDDYDVIYTGAVAAKARGKRIVAFIGDSRIEWGLDPDAVQQVIAERNLRDVEVYNLALPGRNVRTILARLNEVGFYPDVLVVGYSHLSFYWSKNYFTEQPQYLSWWKSDLNRFRSLVQRKILAAPFAATEIWNVLFNGLKITGPALASWLDRVDISPRGQARVHYRLTEEEAVAFQKKSYQDMYKVTMTDEMVEATNASFLKDISIQRDHGTKVLLLKMPLSEWSLELERANEKTTLADLGNYLKTPFLDGNEVPGATAMKSFDGLHLTPPAAAVFGRWTAENFVLPNLK
jgi:hypothetical protein